MELTLVAGLTLDTIRAVVAIALVAAAAATDLRWGIIPNPLVAAGFALGLALAAAAGQPGDVLAGFAAAGALGALRLAGSMLYGRPGMGMGDVKLAAAVGVLVGWQVLWVLYVAVMIGGALGLVALVRGHATMPFAPSIALATALQLTVLPGFLPW